MIYHHAICALLFAILCLLKIRLVLINNLRELNLKTSQCLTVCLASSCLSFCRAKRKCCQKWCPSIDPSRIIRTPRFTKAPPLLHPLHPILLALPPPHPISSCPTSSYHIPSQLIPTHPFKSPASPINRAPPLLNHHRPTPPITALAHPWLNNPVSAHGP